MVSFICNACGQTVRKNQVEKHYSTVCRQCEVLSCIDCGKDFHGDDYANHTSCISEAEKYQGKLFQPKDKANKGEQKQQEWIKQVLEVTSSDIDPSIKRHLKTLKQYSNIPRKKTKFQNFCKNSVNIYDQPTLDKLWDAFSGAKESASTNGTTQENMTEQTTENNNNDEDNKQQEELISEGSSDQPVDKKLKNKKEKRKRKKNQVKMEENGSKLKAEKYDLEVVEEKQHKKKSKKKRKQEQDENQNDTADESTKVVSAEKNGLAEKCAEEPNQIEKGKFNWGSVIKQVLKKSPDNELPVKKLRKKVIAEFLSRGGDGKAYSDSELKALFFAKLQKNPKCKVKKEVAKLCK